ncbi:sigma-70 family RNA polymerase sigma factor [Emticicia sp. CRIBPO]|uniref:RNA polymerase sigma factor n=1 Tax=Emticicia sp. CRIBPO TaxID=2683258 RepID=UPI00141252D4|nr:RNA polymerase sigma factor [Emticicia sp. CRIBPO]NBA87929.1 sigma-70 family RNA polymerase sigma factor [Emticicia sp. CRIBPO]
MSETELIDGCRKHDPKFQRQLYDRYKNAMYSLAYRLVGDFEDAQDVLQEAFIEVFRNLDSFKGESTLGAWIKTILTRKAIKKFRSRIRFEKYEDLPENTLIEWETGMDVEMLEKALLSLPEGFRTVLVLYEIEGYKHTEIARMLEISEGTSKSQLFYAKKKLKELIGQLR